MSEIAEELDVNSDAGFLAALGRATGREVDEATLEQVEESDRSVAGGLETEKEESQLRDEHGRFVKPEAKPVEEGAAPKEGEEVQTDPALAALLERHGGDANAALAAALKERDEAQSLIGRQGNELGQVREQIAELRGRLEASVAPAPVAPIPTVTPSDLEWIEEQVSERGGRAVVAWAADNAPHLIDQAFQAWIADNPGEAVPAYSDYRVQVSLGRHAPAETKAPEPDPTLQEIKLERQMGASIAQVRSSLSEPEWLAIKDHLVPVLQDESTPLIIKNAVVSPDEPTQLQGINALVQIARGRAIAAATADAEKASKEKAAQIKGAARVATGSLRPVEERKPEDGEEKTSEEIQRSFKEALLRTETTSVREGLTYGPRQ